MKSISPTFLDFGSHQIRPLVSPPFQISRHPPSPLFKTLNLPSKTPNFPIIFRTSAAKSQQTHLRNRAQEANDDGIPSDSVKTLAKFKSRHNYIRVLEVSRRIDHPFAGSRLLLLDNPGNIHSISFLLKTLTDTYFDIFATLPPILPPGPIAIFGFGAGSAARIILKIFPTSEIHGWELDPSVISVGREFFGLSKLERQHPKNLSIYVGDALKAEMVDGFSGILVDLFCKGSLLPELQDWKTWERMKRNLRKGGRIMVNCGGSCVEAEDPKRNGEFVKQKTLKAMDRVFPGDLYVLDLGHRKEDSCLALTGSLPDLDVWKKALPEEIRCYVDMWHPLS